MAKLDPTAATTKWVNNLSAATPSITKGVQDVQTAPGVLAAQQASKWLAKIQASAQKWAKNVAAVSLSDWQNSMLNIGIQRIAQGAQAKQSKYTAFAQSFYPYLATGMAKVAAMPSTSLEDGINRAVTMIRYNAAYKGKNA